MLFISENRKIFLIDKYQLQINKIEKSYLIFDLKLCMEDLFLLMEMDI